MFLMDNFLIELHQLPLSEHFSERDKQMLKNLDFKTNAFGLGGKSFRINSYGYLEISLRETKILGKDERPFPDTQNIQGIYGSELVTKEVWEMVQHTGNICISMQTPNDAYFKNELISFMLHFDGGKLVGIKHYKDKGVSHLFHQVDVYLIVCKRDGNIWFSKPVMLGFWDKAIHAPNIEADKDSEEYVHFMRHFAGKCVGGVNDTELFYIDYMKYNIIIQ